MRAEAIRVAAEGIGTDDPERVMALARELYPEQASAIVSTVFTAWAKEDPKLAGMFRTTADVELVPVVLENVRRDASCGCRRS